MIILIVCCCAVAGGIVVMNAAAVVVASAIAVNRVMVYIRDFVIPSALHIIHLSIKAENSGSIKYKRVHSYRRVNSSLDQVVD